MHCAFSLVAVNKSEIGLRVLFSGNGAACFPYRPTVALSLSPASAYGGPREKPSPTLQHAAQRMVFERKESNCVKSVVRW